MTATDNNKMMEEIRRRLESDGWNFEMAGRVMERKRKTFRVRLMAGGLATALASLAVALVMVLDTPGKPPETEMYAFISRQVEGAYGAVFDKQAVSATPPYVVPVAFSYERVDGLIDNALAAR